MGVVSRLDLAVSAEDQRALVARKSTNLEALKLLLEAEGSAAPEPKPQSRAPRWLALGWPVAPLAAHAAEVADARAEILALLEHYRRAMEARDLQALAAVYAEFPAEQETAQRRYFENVRELRVAIDNVDVAVVGDEAVVSYTRTDDFTDARTGRPMHVAVRLTKVARRQNGAWKLAGGKVGAWSSPFSGRFQPQRSRREYANGPGSSTVALPSAWVTRPRKSVSCRSPEPSGRIANICPP